MKTVEELMDILSELPPKSRVMVGDSWEGTIRDIDTMELRPSDKYWTEYERNGERVVEIEVTKTDEFWESWNRQKELERQQFDTELVDPNLLDTYVDERAIAKSYENYLRGRKGIYADSGPANISRGLFQK